MMSKLGIILFLVVSIYRCDDYTSSLYEIDVSSESYFEELCKYLSGYVLSEKDEERIYEEAKEYIAEQEHSEAIVRLEILLQNGSNDMKITYLYLLAAMYFNINKFHRALLLYLKFCQESEINYPKDYKNRGSLCLIRAAHASWAIGLKRLSYQLIEKQKKTFPNHRYTKIEKTIIDRLLKEQDLSIKNDLT